MQQPDESNVVNVLYRSIVAIPERIQQMQSAMGLSPLAASQNAARRSGGQLAHARIRGWTADIGSLWLLACFTGLIVSLATMIIPLTQGTWRALYLVRFLVSFVLPLVTAVALASYLTNIFRLMIVLGVTALPALPGLLAGLDLVNRPIHEQVFFESSDGWCGPLDDQYNLHFNCRRFNDMSAPPLSTCGRVVGEGQGASACHNLIEWKFNGIVWLDILPYTQRIVMPAIEPFPDFD
jgi:hypothetical protein